MAPSMLFDTWHNTDFHVDHAFFTLGLVYFVVGQQVDFYCLSDECVA